MDVAADYTQAQLSELTVRFRERASEWDRTEKYPHENVRDLVAHGLMGLTIPTDLGGPGQSLAEVVRIVEEVASACGITGRIVVDGNLGALTMVMRGGPDWMRKRVADLVRGGDKPTIQISELDAGTDVNGIRTTAVLDGGSVLLNGTKMWITGAADSIANVVVARLIENGIDAGLCAVYVETGTDGLSLGQRQYMMGLRGIPEMEVKYVNCAVPASHIIMRGLKDIMSCYNLQRLGAAAVALGIAQGAFDDAVAYSARRKQFGTAISEFQGLRWRLVDCKLQLDAARLLIERAATALDDVTGLPRPELAAAAKIFTAEMAIRVTSEALQLHGALGYSRNIRIERLYRDARMFTIGGGTTESLRNLCARDLFRRYEISQTSARDHD